MIALTRSFPVSLFDNSVVSLGAHPQLSDYQMAQNVQPERSSLSGRSSVHHSTESNQESEMEGLIEEVNQYHPMG